LARTEVEKADAPDFFVLLLRKGDERRGEEANSNAVNERPPIRH